MSKHKYKVEGTNLKNGDEELFYIIERDIGDVVSDCRVRHNINPHYIEDMGRVGNNMKVSTIIHIY